MGVNFCFSPILHQHQQEKFLQQIDIHSTAMEATWQSDGSHRKTKTSLKTDQITTMDCMQS